LDDWFLFNSHNSAAERICVKRSDWPDECLRWWLLSRSI
jgi:hypothetical protein